LHFQRLKDLLLDVFPESLVDASFSFPFSVFNAEPRLIFECASLRSIDCSSLESIYHPMRYNPETTPPWEPIAAALTRGAEMDPRSRSRLVERAAVGEGG
jgi:hypothetical protein